MVRVGRSARCSRRLHPCGKPAETAAGARAGMIGRPGAAVWSEETLALLPEMVDEALFGARRYFPSTSEDRAGTVSQRCGPRIPGCGGWRATASRIFSRETISVGFWRSEAGWNSKADGHGTGARGADGRCESASKRAGGWGGVGWSTCLVAFSPSFRFKLLDPGATEISTSRSRFVQVCAFVSCSSSPLGGHRESRVRVFPLLYEPPGALVRRFRP
jgi:hypothetical protein